MKPSTIILSILLASSSFALCQPVVQTPPDESYYTDERPALIFSTDFIVPMVRYDLLEIRESVNPKGRVSAFNSLGAGFSVAFGSLTTRFTDSLRTKIDKKNGFDFKNIIAIQGGVLFSIDQKAGENNNIFAPCIGLSALDFSLMWGYDFAHSDTQLDGHFFTIAYNVPLRKILHKSIIPIHRFTIKNETRDKIPGKGIQTLN